LTVPTSIRVASVLLWIIGVGFGVFCPPAIARVLRGRPLPRPFGFPAYGEGPFERHGIRSGAPLLTAFLLVCALECVAGWLLWGGHLTGAVLALALVPVGAVFWWGFALPLPPLFALPGAMLTLAGWSDLR